MSFKTQAAKLQAATFAPSNSSAMMSIECRPSSVIQCHPVSSSVSILSFIGRLGLLCLGSRCCTLRGLQYLVSLRGRIMDEAKRGFWASALRSLQLQL